VAQALKTIEPQAAARLQEQGALMVDVREAGEHARARIPGSESAPISALSTVELAIDAGRPVVFFCGSGNRTSIYAAALAEKARSAPAYVMRGGLSAWVSAGLPVETVTAGRQALRPDAGSLCCFFRR
jgi:rhodanese-related sulfurtransferase